MIAILYGTLKGRNCLPRDALDWHRGNERETKEEIMRKLLLAAVAFGLLAATVPASAQVYSDRWGTGVQVGPFEFGVGPRYDRRYWRDDWGDRGRYAYGMSGCRVVRDRVETPSGRIIFRTHRICD